MLTFANLNEAIVYTMNNNTLLFCLLSLLLSACAGRSAQRSVDNDATPIKLSHARHFTLARTDSFTVVTVLNPWQQGEVYATYYLVKDAHTPTPSDGHKVVIPIKSLMANSVTHLGFLELLDELPAITGVCSADYIYNPYIKEAVKEGNVQDLGDAFSLNIEKLLLLRPQAVMTTAYNADDANSKKMRQTGLTLIYNIEWQEKSLLGRAEWIKFMGAFFDKEALADSIFATIEERYHSIKAIAAAVVHKPTVLSGQDYRGAWSMPGGRSFNAQLFSDAGGDYFYKNDSTTGSISTTIEEAMLHFSKADIWVGTQVNTLTELGKIESKYKLFNAYKTGNVYNTNRRTNATGGNDYWESAIARPDLLLSDMIAIFHPGLLPEYELTYLNRLTE